MTSHIFPNNYAATRRFVLSIMHAANADPVITVDALSATRQSMNSHDLLSDLLSKGDIDKAIKQNDAAYNWNSYHDYIDYGVRKERAGSFIAKNFQLNMQSIDWEKLTELWLWLLTEQASNCSPSKMPPTPDKTLDDFISTLWGNEADGKLIGNPADWCFFNVEPNFLNAHEDCEEEDALLLDTELSFFDSIGMDLAIFGHSRTHYFLMLFSAYPGYSQPHPLITIQR